jgi:hypothetical protein
MIDHGALLIALLHLQQRRSAILILFMTRLRM